MKPWLIRSLLCLCLSEVGCKKVLLTFPLCFFSPFLSDNIQPTSPLIGRLSLHACLIIACASIWSHKHEDTVTLGRTAATFRNPFHDTHKSQLTLPRVPVGPVWPHRSPCQLWPLLWKPKTFLPARSSSTEATCRPVWVPQRRPGSPKLLFCPSVSRRWWLTGNPVERCHLRMLRPWPGHPKRWEKAQGLALSVVWILQFLLYPWAPLIQWARSWICQKTCWLNPRARTVKRGLHGSRVLVFLPRLQVSWICGVIHESINYISKCNVKLSFLP